MAIPIAVRGANDAVDREALRAFGAELDRLKERTFARVGAEDVRHVHRLDAFSHLMEVVGRVLIHVSVDPVTFGVGVGALWVHKQLQAIEIGHTVLHGAYDRLEEGGGAFHSSTFRWDIPIDETAWRDGHNFRHHGHTNIAGRDPDIEFGPVRLTSETPWAPHHRWQTLFAVGPLATNFTLLMNVHFNGLYQEINDPAHTGSSVRAAWRRTRRKYLPYYLRNYVFFPALAGPFFPKVLLGNWMAETMRDVYSAATIYCGHVGPEVRCYPVGTRAKSRAEWYAMQVEATNNFEVSGPISVLCGGLNLQIEHHLFPTLPPQRLRAIAPEVRAICERHGISYRSSSWPLALRRVLAHLRLLAHDLGQPDRAAPTSNGT